jgi:hydrogenase maturation protein HypF
LDALGEVPDLPAFGAVPDSERDIVRQQALSGLNAPRTSSMGRLFDAVSALAGICTAITFEAQAAIALEMLATPYIESGAKVPRLPVEIGPDGVIALAPLLGGIVEKVEAGRGPGMIAAAFHVWAAEVALVMALHAQKASGLRTVALGGGVWQNRLLLALAVPRLQGAGFEVLVRERIPPGDGGLSLGQAAVAAATM